MSLFGDLALLDNVIYSRQTRDAELSKAKALHRKLLGNYKLNKADVKYINELRNRKVIV